MNVILKVMKLMLKCSINTGKYDKEGNLKTPALQKKWYSSAGRLLNWFPAFNRITDDTDAKIVINKTFGMN